MFIFVTVLKISLCEKTIKDERKMNRRGGLSNEVCMHTNMWRDGRVQVHQGEGARFPQKLMRHAASKLKFIFCVQNFQSFSITIMMFLAFWSKGGVLFPPNAFFTQNWL